MADKPGPQRNPVVEALLGLLLSLGILPAEFVAMITIGGLLGGSAITVFWIFLTVGAAYFGFLFWMAVRKGRKAMLPGLIVGAALWSLLATACYQLVGL